MKTYRETIYLASNPISDGSHEHYWRMSGCGDTRGVQAQDGLALVNAMHVSNGG